MDGRRLGRSGGLGRTGRGLRGARVLLMSVSVQSVLMVLGVC